MRVNLLADFMSINVEVNFKKFWLTFLPALVFVHSLLFLYFFWQTPLGQTPVLDGAENILLAERIFQGNLAAEPFYRAMLYPAFLAAFRFMGFAIEDLGAVAAVSGIFFHLLNSLLVSYLSFLLWKGWRPAFLAFMLYGFYPLALHFAADPLDITLAISFLLIATIFLIKSSRENQQWHNSALAGFNLGVGALFRANILPVAAVWLLMLLRNGSRKRALLALIALALPLLAGGMANYLHSGQFRLLPWQGSFNLYAANCANANGRYFQQTLLVTDRELGINPARLESEILYFHETNDKAPLDIDKFNRFWRRKTFAEIWQKPFMWLKLLSKKIYFLFNNFEQYNNKTFSFHKQLSPILRFNPLCFGLIFLLLSIAIFNFKLEIEHKILLQTLVFIGLGVIAFYVSARFRILMLPLMTGFASGVASLPAPRFFSRRNSVVAIIAGFLTFSPFFDAADTSTFNSDRLLMAHACARLGLDEQQFCWANEVLNSQPENVQAIRLKLVGFTNLALSGKLSEANAWHQVIPELEFLERMKLRFNDTRFLQGCYFYKIRKQPEKALQIWQEGLEESQQKDLFLSALIITKNSQAKTGMIENAQNSPLLWYALNQAGLVEAQSSGQMKINEMAMKFLIDQGS